MDLPQHFPIYEVTNFYAGNPENIAEYGFVIFSRNVGDAGWREAILSEPNRWSDSGDPANLWMINFPGKTALA